MPDFETMKERMELIKERISQIPGENSAAESYRPYFTELALLLQKTFAITERDDTIKGFSLEELEKENRDLYQAILPENYESCFGNPAYAAACFGEEMGAYLAMLYSEIRHIIPFAFEKKLWDMTILGELFLEVYGCFTDGNVPKTKEIKDILYWFFSDYSEDIVAERIASQVDPSLNTFAKSIIMDSDLNDLSYLYRYGEYISDNERGVAAFLNKMPQEEVDAMARTYTEGYRIGFVHAGIDLSKKKAVDIRYPIGFERMIRAAILQFEEMGLEPTLFSCARHAVSRRLMHKLGYYSSSANTQFEYDHKTDDALFLDEDFVGRKLRVTQLAYEAVKEQAAAYAGPAVIETFGEKTFTPVNKIECLTYTEKQQKLLTRMQNELGQITNRYIHGDERSFTIIAYPIPEIGDAFEEIFAETVKVNTLDYKLYEDIQQTIIDTLDKGQRVHVLGSGENKTDLWINLWKLNDPSKESIFENCVADVNIPVGEVFTSPVLEGTNGRLYVSYVYLEGLLYKDLCIDFENGCIKDYSCSNFADPEENKHYIKENILFNHDTLPIGEFAIGTNTTAYVMARHFGIEDKMPILIAEKTGPHFAVGDTCYSWMEDTKIYNPDGKEIVAKENEVSANRKTDLSKAYMNCHTDITIPYDELGLIAVELADGSQIEIIRDGAFVLEGTQELNKPLEGMKVNK